MAMMSYKKEEAAMRRVEEDATESSSEESVLDNCSHEDAEEHTWQKSRNPGILDPLMSIWGQPRVALYIWTYLVKFWLI